MSPQSSFERDLDIGDWSNCTDRREATRDFIVGEIEDSEAFVVADGRWDFSGEAFVAEELASDGVSSAEDLRPVARLRRGVPRRGPRRVA